MMKLELTKKQAIMIAGILGATEGLELTEVYRKLTKEFGNTEREISYDITNLIYEEFNVHKDDIHINEDYLYAEAKKLNSDE